MKTSRRKKLTVIIITGICLMCLAGCGAEAEEKQVSETASIERIEGEDFLEEGNVREEEAVQEEAASEEEIISGDRIPMVMADDTLYIDTGKESTVTARCGMMDGEITSTVDAAEIPSENGQSNFGSGYGWQYGESGTIEVYMNEKWWVFKAQDE